MGFTKPVLPPYDAVEWSTKAFPERARLACESWALDGFGSPSGVYLVYALKIVFYVGVWAFFCSFTPGLGHLGSISDWWVRPEAFQKAILWSVLFEGLGLGCGSGPLTGRYVPPVGGFLYFLRPGTTKNPAIPGLPLFGANRRTPLDCLLYAAVVVLLVVALVSSYPSTGILIAIVALYAVLGLIDKGMFLSARPEHYLTALVIFVLADNWIPGAKALWLALWFWAGFSKLNHHFTAVVGTMTSNNPFTQPFKWLRRGMYRDFPRDMSPSWRANIAHGGTIVEFAVPTLLFLGKGGTVTTVGLCLMVFLHCFIMSNVPAGVPLEWNVMMMYGGFFLFWQHPHVSIFDMSTPTGVFLAVMLIAIPALGNLFPSRISFLFAMRYYAGNWPYSVWLFRGDSHRKLERLTKWAPWVPDQLMKMYDENTAIAISGKLVGFRLMHLQGRALGLLVPKAVDRFEEYAWTDGEILCGMVCGWNFGDGHLHNEQLLQAVQEQCGFEEGELRCIFVESQPVGRHTLNYRIADAKTGQIEEGDVDVHELRRRQPWTMGPLDVAGSQP